MIEHTALGAAGLLLLVLVTLSVFAAVDGFVRGLLGGNIMEATSADTARLGAQLFRLLLAAGLGALCYLIGLWLRP